MGRLRRFLARPPPLSQRALFLVIARRSSLQGLLEIAGLLLQFSATSAFHPNEADEAACVSPGRLCDTFAAGSSTPLANALGERTSSVAVHRGQRRARAPAVDDRVKD